VAKTRIVLADDHEVVREGLRALLEAQPDFEVVGEAGTVEEAVRRTGLDTPNLVILDLRLPDGSGVEACREIRSQWPDVKVLFLTSYADDEALMGAILAGASGYVLKRVDSVGLLASVRRAATGESLMDPAMTKRLFRRLQGEDAEDSRLEKLSPQERSLLDHIATGLTNRQIAEKMFLAEKTVKNYVSNLLRKLEMRRRSEAAAFGARVAVEREHRYPPEQWGTPRS